jgi:hypothetical protein
LAVRQQHVDNARDMQLFSVNPNNKIVLNRPYLSLVGVAPRLAVTLNPFKNSRKNQKNTLTSRRLPPHRGFTIFAPPPARMVNSGPITFNTTHCLRTVAALVRNVRLFLCPPFSTSRGFERTVVLGPKALAFGPDLSRSQAVDLPRPLPRPTGPRHPNFVTVITSLSWSRANFSAVGSAAHCLRSEAEASLHRDNT